MTLLSSSIAYVLSFEISHSSVSLVHVYQSLCVVSLSSYQCLINIIIISVVLFFVLSHISIFVNPQDMSLYSARPSARKARRVFMPWPAKCTWLPVNSRRLQSPQGKLVERRPSVSSFPDMGVVFIFIRFPRSTLAMLSFDDAALGGAPFVKYHSPISRNVCLGTCVYFTPNRRGGNGEYLIDRIVCCCRRHARPRPT